MVKKVGKKILICILVLLLLFNFIMSIGGDLGNVYADTSEEVQAETEDSLNNNTNWFVKLIISGIKWCSRAIGSVFTLLSYYVLSSGGVSEEVEKKVYVSPMDIFFDRFPLTNINIFKTDEDGNTAGFVVTIRTIALALFQAVDILCLVILFIVFMISFARRFVLNLPDEKKSASDAMADCAWSLALVGFMNLIIVVVFNLNEMLIEMLEKFADPLDAGAILESLGSQTFNASIMLSIGSAIAYIMICWQTFKFCIQYIIRFFTVTILTIVSPVMGLVYNRSRVRGGNPSVFNRWFKLFISNVLIQVIDCVLYIAFVAIPLASADTSISSLESLGVVVLLIAGLMFVKQGEKMLMSLFGMDDSVVSMNMISNGISRTTTSVRNSVTSRVSSAVNVTNNNVPFGIDQSSNALPSSSQGVFTSIRTRVNEFMNGGGALTAKAAEENQDNNNKTTGGNDTKIEEEQNNSTEDIDIVVDSNGTAYDSRLIDSRYIRDGRIVDEEEQNNSIEDIDIVVAPDGTAYDSRLIDPEYVHDGRIDEEWYEEHKDEIKMHEVEETETDSEETVNETTTIAPEDAEGRLNEERARRESLEEFKIDYAKLLDELRNKNDLENIQKNLDNSISNLNSIEAQFKNEKFDGKTIDVSSLRQELEEIYEKDKLEGIKEYINEKQKLNPSHYSVDGAELEYAKAFYSWMENQEKLNSAQESRKKDIDDLVRGDEAEKIFNEDELKALINNAQNIAFRNGVDVSSDIFNKKADEINNSIKTLEDTINSRGGGAQLDVLKDQTLLYKVYNNDNMKKIIKETTTPLEVFDGKIDVSYEYVSRIVENFANNQYTDENFKKIMAKVREEGDEAVKNVNAFCDAKSTKEATAVARKLNSNAQISAVRFYTERKIGSMFAVAASTEYAQESVTNVGQRTIKNGNNQVNGANNTSNDLTPLLEDIQGRTSQRQNNDRYDNNNNNNNRNGNNDSNNNQS